MNNSEPTFTIAHIASGDLWAGAEVQILTQLQALKQDKNLSIYAVILNHGELSRKLNQAGIETIVLDETQLNSWKIMLDLRKIFQRIQPDIIHCHRQKENILASIASISSTKSNLITTIHGNKEQQPPLWMIHKYGTYIFNWYVKRYLFSTIIAVSNELGNKLKDNYPHNLIQTIENGIDIEGVKALANDQNFSVNSKENYNIGIAGRLEQVKRVDIFIDMASQLIRDAETNSFHFHIFGDGSLMPSLKEKASKQAMTAHISFHGHRNDMPSCLKVMDCLIMCSDHEGMPMTPLESIAVGTPVIAHKVGGLIDMIGPINDKLLVSDHNPTGYAKAVSRLLNNKEDLAAIKDEGLKRITQHYTAKANSIKVSNIYKEVLMKVE